jgi:2-oxoisovalerate dehydrogenase E1 component alpha subunit
LIKQLWWDESRDEKLHKEFRSEILAQLKLAEKRPKPPLDDMITDVYKTPPRHLVEQFKSLEDHIAKYPNSYKMHGEG